VVPEQHISGKDYKSLEIEGEIKYICKILLLNLNEQHWYFLLFFERINPGIANRKYSKSMCNS
jgi:hypothetical protein